MKKIDDVIKDWGEEYTYGQVKGRKCKNIKGRRVLKSTPTQRPAGRENLKAAINKAPEVMVKITTGKKDPSTNKPRPIMTDMRSIKAHLDYISRNGNVELEDEQGNILAGKEAVREARNDWAGCGDIPYEDGTRREAFNIVLSMPPGTDRPSVKNAARAFAAEMFTGYQYVMAAHEDEKHPHVHLTVKAFNQEGVRLNPRKADLQHWREVFAEKLRDQGIEASATPRKVRGVVKKAEKQVVRIIDREHTRGERKVPSRVNLAQRESAEQEAQEGAAHVNPAQANILKQRKRAQHNFGTVARALAAGDEEDKRLAVEIVRFVEQMPPIVTKHEQLVKDVLQKTANPIDEINKTNNNELER